MNLRKLREDAKLSQQDLANALQSRADRRAEERIAAGEDSEPAESWDQSKVSRYEARPESAPLGAVMAMVEVLGGPSIEIPHTSLEGVDAGTPYAELMTRLDAIDRFIAAHGFDVGGDAEAIAEVEPLRDLAVRFRDKPYVGILGRFDAGKSTIANTLLGQRHLPTSYQPTTWLPSYIRHIEDRPRWIKHPVLMMGPGFDPSRWRDEGHVKAHESRSGSLELLERSKDHEPTTGGGSAERSETCALVFLESPVLHACTLVDLPGHGETAASDPHVNIEFEAVIVASQSSGFLDVADLGLISDVVERMTGRSPDGSIDEALARVIVVATHAHLSADQLRDDVLAGGAARLLRQLSTIDSTVTVEALSARMVGFETGSRTLVMAFQELAREMLAVTLPAETLAVRWPAVEAQRAHLDQRWTRALAASRAATEDDTDFAADADFLVADRDRYLSEVETAADRARQAIKDRRTRSISGVRSILRGYTEEHIQSVLNQRFPDKKDAVKHAGAFFSSQIRHEVNTEVNDQIELIDRELGRFVDSVEASLNTGSGFAGTLSAAADVKTRFIGGLGAGAVGAAGVGAVGIYAAGLGNLGAYILVAQGVSALSAVGISVGGVAPAVAAVAAVGGPVAIGVGAVVLLAAGGAALARGPWDKQLAKQIRKKVVLPLEAGRGARGSTDATPSLPEALLQFWATFSEQFEDGVRGVAAAYEQRIVDLREHASDVAFHEAQVARLTGRLAALHALIPPVAPGHSN